MSGANGIGTKTRAKSARRFSIKSEDVHLKQISRTGARAQSKTQTSQADDVSEDHEDGNVDSEQAEDDIYNIEDDKDDAELELEKLVFGDSKGFMDSVRAFGKGQGADTVMHDQSDDEEVDEDVQGGMRDQDLFFIDTATAAENPVTFSHDTGREMDSSDDDVTGTALGRHNAAWQDSDDERISVSLAAVPRLRKLRATADEDIVSGKEYIRRLRKQYLLLNPTPDWAIEARQQPPNKKRRLSRDADDSGSDISSGEEDEDGDEQLATKPLSDLLRNAAGLVRSGNSTKARKLRPETIDIQRVRDVGTTQPSSVDSISFHPTLPLLLTSGPSGTLFLHHIIPSPPAPEPNPLLTSLHLRSTPLTTTAFHPTDSRIFLSARRRYFHIWDVATGRVEKITRTYGHAHEQRSMEVLRPSPCGRWVALKGSSRKGGGLVNILSAATLQWHSQVRIDSGQGVADFAWWRSGAGLTIVGKNGEVTEWSLEKEEVVGRWVDAGAVGTTVLALGGKLGVEGKAAPLGSDRWVAIGSSSGVVNIYDRAAWAKTDVPAAPQPTRMLDHLTTPVSTLAFSPDAQLLAVASRWKKDALRLVHLPTCTVYKNWPTAATPLGRVTGAAFGAGEEGGMMRFVVGNEAGRVRMWEIRP